MRAGLGWTLTAILASTLALPSMALAQDVSKTQDAPGTDGVTAGAEQTPRSQGPMTVERVHSGPMISPDVRWTRFNGTNATLAGAYGGWVVDSHLLLGAGGYGQTNGTHTRNLAYGGAVVGWLGGMDDPIGFSIRTLIGFGQATTPATILTFPVPLPFDVDRNRVPVPTVPSVPVTVGVRRDFFVAEPQADVLIRINSLMRVDVGAGYRAVANDYGRYNDGFNTVSTPNMSGASASVSLQIGGGTGR